MIGLGMIGGLLKSPKVIVGLSAALVVAILVGAMLMYRQSAIVAEGKLEATRTQLARTIEINEANAAAFRRYQLTQEANDKLLQQLATNYAAINQATVATQQQLKEVAAQNAEVKAYLTTRLPAAVSGLLNSTTNNSRQVSK